MLDIAARPARPMVPRPCHTDGAGYSATSEHVIGQTPGNRRTRRNAARCRRALLAPAVCGAVLIGAPLSIARASAGAPSLQAPAVFNDAAGGDVKALPLDGHLLLPFPARSAFSISPSGATLLRSRLVHGLDGSTQLRLEAKQAGRAVVSITPPDGPTKSYTIEVGGIRDGGNGPVDVSASSSVTATSPPSDKTAEARPAPTSTVAPLPNLQTAPDATPGSHREGSLPSGMAPLYPEAGEPQISPVLPQPARLAPGRRTFPTPTGAQRQLAGRSRPQPTGRNIVVTQGQARFLGFRTNILTVFFSDPAVMDARAMNARTVAVTGSTPGRSTLAVFVSQHAGDVVGRAEIWNIVVEPATTRTAPDAGRDAGSLELAIRSALNDPRIAVQVIARPDGTFAARLTGTVRDATEIKAATDTAALFMPHEQVISSIVLDPQAPTLAQALYPTAPIAEEQVYEAKLRQITGNNSIELISLPTGLAVKAEVDSPADAEALLNLLPTLNQRVLPFIVVRGQRSADQSTLEGAEGKYYGAQRPILTGEDQEITRKLHEVTGVRTVYAVRTAINAIALYGTARNLIEYETVRRYILMLPLIAPQGGGGAVATTTGSTRSASSPLLGNAGVNANARGGAGNAGALVSPQLNSNAQILPGAGATGFVATPGVVTGVPIGAVDNAGAPSFGPLASVNAGTSQSFLSSQAPGFISNPDALQNQINAATQPASGFRQSINVQMFVRILDPQGQAVRRVTVETSIVEISRSTLRNIGVQAGSVGLLTESVNRTAPTVVPGVPGANGQGSIPPVVIPGTSQRTITTDNTLRSGIFGAGESVTGALRNLDPLRVRLDALYQKGNARLLSSPNISAIEGAEAQITVGGERPVPSAVTTGQAVGQTITFRRFGIILTMRPTVTDDDTIILQIRADVTELASEFGVTINGALIPGERVRSIDTVLNVRDGDTIVLGGLIANDRREQTSRIPILSSIPILGNLFKSRRFENNESELAIFMSPRITRVGASINTREAMQRVPGLPELRGNQQAVGAFGLGGQSSGGQ